VVHYFHVFHMSLSAALVHVSTANCAACSAAHERVYLNSNPEHLFAFWPWPLTFDLVCNVTRGIQPSCQFWWFVTFLCRDVGKYASNWRFPWCGSSYSIRIPSLKFVGLSCWKIWLILCHGIKRPGDLDLCSFDFALVCNARDNFPANAGVSVTYLKYIVEIVNEFCCLGGLRSAIAKVRHSKGPPSQKARAAYTGRRNLNLMGGYTRD